MRWAALAAAMGMGCAMTGEPAPLLPESEAVRQCYDWPGKAWSKSHNVELGTQLKAGDRAVDLTLRQPDGAEVSIGELLSTKPVLLVSGSATCPRYRDGESGIRSLVKSHGDKVHVAVVYTMEAHPKTEPNAYSGRRKPKSHSDRNQATTWKKRAKDAQDLSTGKALVLVDDLDGTSSNPFWCTYGTCPNCAFLIDQDGTLAAVHEWFDPPTMGGSIDALNR